MSRSIGGNKCVHTVDIHTEKRRIKWGSGMHVGKRLLSLGLRHMMHQEPRWLMFAVRTGDQPLVPMIQLSDPQLSWSDCLQHVGRSDCSLVSQAECFGMKTFVLGRHRVRWLSKSSEGNHKAGADRSTLFVGPQERLVSRCVHARVWGLQT